MENVLTATGVRSTAPALRVAAWVILICLALAGLAVVLVPAWVIQPFKPQTEAGLAWSYTLRRWSPAVTLAAAAGSLALVLWLWRGARRWWRKTALVLVVALTLASAWLARQNHFEWMFHPLAEAAYAATGDAAFLADTDMVLAVQSHGESVAYPVRQMAYHHVVQDVVGGTPIVATY